MSITYQSNPLVPTNRNLGKEKLTKLKIISIISGITIIITVMPATMRGKALQVKINIQICWDTPKEPVWCEYSGTVFKNKISLGIFENFFSSPKTQKTEEKVTFPGFWIRGWEKWFFSKNPTGIFSFETSSWILTSNRFFWCISAYRDINFHLKCLPAHCGE